MIKFLVIDDEDGLRSQIKKVLSLIGSDTDEASNGEQGLELAKKNDYDLIICDVKMPKLDGYKLIEELHKDPEKESIPFIFLTSNIEKEEIRRGMTLGADDYITKPFKTEDLLSAINTRLAKKAKLDKLYDKKYSEIIKKFKQNILLNNQTGLPNEIALNTKLKDINIPANKNIITCLYDIEIDGYNEIRNILNYDTIGKIINQIIDRIKILDLKDKMLFQISDNEFAIMWQNNKNSIEKNKAEIEKFAILILNRINESIKSENFNLNFTASIGMSMNIDNFAFLSGSELLTNAKIAKNFVIKNGGNNYKIYTNEIRSQLGDIDKDNLKKIINVKKDVSNVSKNIQLENKEKILQQSDETKIKETDIEKIKTNTDEIYEVKIFFLYPHSVIQKDLVKELVKNEYAVYILKDHLKALQLLKKYEYSILFINIDSTLSESEWDKYIQNIQKDPEIKNARIGILTYYDTQEKAKKYLFEFMISCGFIKLKLGFEESKDIILNALKSIDAKGKRKYIRVKCDKEQNVSFSIQISNKYYDGIILDISSVGMAITFKNKEKLFEENMILKNIQLRLKGHIFMVDGKIQMIRQDNEGNYIYVILFINIHYEIKNKLYSFINKMLQRSIDKELDEL